MFKLNGHVTDQCDFFQGHDPFDLTQKYGSPLYIYNERILRQKCRELKKIITYPDFVVQFSIKANSNPAILKIVREEGLWVDAMSLGEIYLQMKAGFLSHEIFYIANNVSKEEMRYAIERKILVSVDSLAQLEQFGQINPGKSVAIRFNPGIGVGHHEKVVTAGKNTKFGVNPEDIPEVKSILKKYGLKLVGINQHIGSLFMQGDSYIQSAENLREIAMQFKDLSFIDFGGGFGIPYHKQENQPCLDLKQLGKKLSEFMESFSKEYGTTLAFKVEPGRYVVAEAGLLLGTVHAVKYNGDTKYVGTDLGMNVLARPSLYASHHDIEVYRQSPSEDTLVYETVSVVGNICESGDILAKSRLLPRIFQGDLLGVLDAGAYGHAMSSNYNSRLRPAELLIREDNTLELIRRRDTLDDLSRPYPMFDE